MSTAIDEDELKAIWKAYRIDGDQKARDRLILTYSPLVKYVAGRLSFGLPSHVEEGDLVSYGLLGLINAIERFEIDREIKFETYAISRIKGAIIDELRSVDWVPRSVRAKARKVEAAVAHLEATLRRSPSEEELAEELDWTVEELQDTLARVSMTSIAALDELLSVGDGDRLSLVDTLQDLTAEQPEEEYEGAETRQMVRQTLLRLTEREQTVLGLYYFEGMTLAQIGGVLGVTESRICQIHTKAVMSLRSKLADRHSA
jgi:RNA polymerase sigma factor FliA